MKNPNLNKIIAENLQKDKFQSKAAPSLPTDSWLNQYKNGGQPCYECAQNMYKKGGGYFPEYNSWAPPRHANGGDISIPDLNPDTWLLKYKGGGPGDGFLGLFKGKGGRGSVACPPMGCGSFNDGTGGGGLHLGEFFNNIGEGIGNFFSNIDLPHIGLPSIKLGWGKHGRVRKRRCIDAGMTWDEETQTCRPTDIIINIPGETRSVSYSSTQPIVDTTTTLMPESNIPLDIVYNSVSPETKYIGIDPQAVNNMRSTAKHGGEHWIKKYAGGGEPCQPGYVRVNGVCIPISSDIYRKAYNQGLSGFGTAASPDYITPGRIETLPSVTVVSNITPEQKAQRLRRKEIENRANQFLKNDNFNIPASDWMGSYGNYLKQQEINSQEAAKIKARQAVGEIKPYIPQSTASKTWEVLTHPMTALKYAVHGQDLPDRFSQGEINPLDYAVNIVNPFSVGDAVASIPGNIARGEFLQAGLNTLSVLPAASELRGVGNLASKTNKLLMSKTPLGNVWKLNPKVANPFGFRNVGDVPNFWKGYTNAINPETIDISSGFKQYTKALNKESSRLYKLQKQGKINQTEYDALFQEAKSNLMSKTPLGKSLGEGAFGQVYEFKNYPEYALKIGMPGLSPINQSFIQNTGQFRNYGNIATPLKANKFKLPSNITSTEVSLMPNLNEVKSIFPTNLSQRDAQALFLKQARQLKDKGIMLDLENLNNVKFNPSKGVYDIYDLGQGNIIKNDPTYLQYVKNRLFPNSPVKFNPGGEVGDDPNKKVKPVYIVLPDGRKIKSDNSSRSVYANYINKFGYTNDGYYEKDGTPVWYAPGYLDNDKPLDLKIKDEVKPMEGVTISENPIISSARKKAREQIGTWENWGKSNATPSWVQNSGFANPMQDLSDQREKYNSIINKTTYQNILDQYPKKEGEDRLAYMNRLNEMLPGFVDKAKGYGLTEPFDPENTTLMKQWGKKGFNHLSALGQAVAMPWDAKAAFQEGIEAGNQPVSGLTAEEAKGVGITQPFESLDDVVYDYGFKPLLNAGDNLVDPNNKNARAVANRYVGPTTTDRIFTGIMNPFNYIGPGELLSGGKNLTGLFSKGKQLDNLSEVVSKISPEVVNNVTKEFSLGDIPAVTREDIINNLGKDDVIFNQYSPEQIYAKTKGRSLNYDETIDLVHKTLTENPELAAGNYPLYFHGSNSSSLAGFTKDKSLKPLGQLLDEGKAPLSGEILFGGLGINKDHISTAFIRNLQDPVNYGAAGTGSKFIDPKVKLQNWETTGRAKWLKDNPSDQSRISLLDDVYAKRAKEWDLMSDAEKKLAEENFPVLYGIKPKSKFSSEADRFRTVSSDIDDEIAFKGAIPHEEIPSIFVPKTKVDYVSQFLGNDKIHVLPLDDIVTRQNKGTKPSWYTWKKGGQINWLNKYK